MVGFLLVLVFVGVDLGVAMGILSFIGIWLIEENFIIPLKLIGSSAYKAVMEYSLSVPPMFILMAMFATLSGAADDAYDGLNLLLAKVPGGLRTATVLANAIFAAICGVSIAAAAVFSKVSLPQMERHGYDRGFALGTVAGSSILGMLIPPSILMVVYGVLVDESIGRLFIAGALPAIFLTLIYCIGIWGMVRWRPSIAGQMASQSRLSPSRNRQGCCQTMAVCHYHHLLPWGAYIPDGLPLRKREPLGAFATFLICVLRRKITPNSLWKIMLDAGYTMAGLYFLFICATMYSRMLAISGVGQVGHPNGHLESIAPLCRHYPYDHCLSSSGMHNRFDLHHDPDHSHLPSRCAFNGI